MIWDTWKKGFDAWETQTARHLEQLLKSPVLLEPSGALLTAAMKAKAAGDEAAGRWWSAWGLPTRRDQERTLYAVQQLSSRLLDLEDELAELRSERA